MEAVRGQEKTRLISPKNFPSVMVAKTTLPSSLTTSTVPLLMKNIWGTSQARLDLLLSVILCAHLTTNVTLLDNVLFAEKESGLYGQGQQLRESNLCVLK